MPHVDLITGQPVETARPVHRERADAARNRARVLAAAERLFTDEDPRRVTMDDIARAAGVGRGTLYRRYPDLRSIAAALLDTNERELQAQLLRGAPPLGPGAPPAERLAAFYRAVTELMSHRVGLYLVTGQEAGPGRFTVGPYGFWRLHVRTLLTAARVTDPEPLIDFLLAPLAPEIYCHQRHTLGMSTERIAAALARLAHAVLGPGPGCRPDPG